MEKINIKTHDSQYPVIIGTSIIDQLQNQLSEAGIAVGNKVLLITDENVAKLYKEMLMGELTDYQVYPYIIEPGEASKSLKGAEEIISFAIKQGLDRSSTVLALGGGVVGDLAGFVASIYMRGVNFVQVPTTILAHDSSVGGKVAVNHALGKNLLGAFYQPKLVFYDTSFLKTLPDNQIRSGLAEVIKHSLIADARFTDWLYHHSEFLLALDLEKMNEALLRAIHIKAEVVKEDEREQGIRAILNYGHTLGHAVETISNYEYLHGEGVAIGIAYAAMLASQMNIIEPKHVDYTIEMIRKFKLPWFVPKHFDNKKLLEIIMRDKKFSSNNIRMVLPTEIGKVAIVQQIELSLLEKTMNLIKR